MGSRIKSLMLILLVFFMTVFSSTSLGLRIIHQKEKYTNKIIYLNYSGSSFNSDVSSLESQRARYSNLGDLNKSSELTENIINDALAKENYSIALTNSIKEIEYLKDLYINSNNIQYINQMINEYYILASICRNYGYVSLASEYFMAANTLDEKFHLKLNAYTEIINSQYYFLNGDYTQSKNDAEIAVNDSNRNHNKNGLALALINLARVEIKMGQYSYAKISLQIVDENKKYIKEKSALAQYDYCYGKYYYNTCNYDEAISYLAQANLLLNKEANYRLGMQVLNDLANSYSKINENTKANEYYKKYIAVNTDYMKTCQNINSAVLSCIQGDSPSKVINEVIISRSRGLYGITLLILFAVVSMLICAIVMNSKRKKKVEDLNEALYRDQLTGAYNRSYLMDKMNSLKNNEESFAITMIDIDDYKVVNDTYGHLFGDRVLIDVVKTMERTLDEKFTIGRYGGEEFLIVVEDIVLEDVVKSIEKLRNNVSNLVWANGSSITISAGIVIHDKELTIEKSIDKADHLLYKAKDLGKNRVEY